MIWTNGLVVIVPSDPVRGSWRGSVPEAVQAPRRRAPRRLGSGFRGLRGQEDRQRRGQGKSRAPPFFSGAKPSGAAPSSYLCEQCVHTGPREWVPGGWPGCRELRTRGSGTAEAVLPPRLWPSDRDLAPQCLSWVDLNSSCDLQTSHFPKGRFSQL